MAPELSSSDTLRSIIEQVERLISTTAPMPDNRSTRCLELLRAATALTQDVRPRRGSQQPEMDESAESARPDLEQNWERWTVRELADWWRQWVGPAGHRCLGRMLMEVARTP